MTVSIEVMTAVWKRSRATGGTLIVLLAVADHANDEGIAWPGVKNLAIKSRLSTRQVQRALRELEKLGELKVKTNGAEYATNLYEVVIRK